jgi:hypothetical protein
LSANRPHAPPPVTDVTAKDLRITNLPSAKGKLNGSSPVTEEYWIGLDTE